MKLRMKDADICKEYREAKDKRMQVVILADMNLCQREDILRILMLNGYDVTPAGPMKLGGENDKVLKLMHTLLDEIDTEIMAAERKYLNVVESLQKYGRA